MQYIVFTTHGTHYMPLSSYSDFGLSQRIFLGCLQRPRKIFSSRATAKHPVRAVDVMEAVMDGGVMMNCSSSYKLATGL
jgi:hypothetical protein